MNELMLTVSEKRRLRLLELAKELVRRAAAEQGNDYSGIRVGLLRGEVAAFKRTHAGKRVGCAVGAGGGGEGGRRGCSCRGWLRGVGHKGWVQFFGERVVDGTAVERERARG